ncbi:MAG: response regulator, partial [Nitrospinae bacterium]|nr:response regulator [Nitrospinota bacterium]
MLTDVFKQAEYNVTSVLEPTEAVGLFRDNKFDLVVSDHAMPNMTGTEFIREIKGIRKEVPVVMVSGYLDKSTIRDLITDGVEGIF